MRRGKKTRDATSFSLFPFLAVLLCTMGALIVLLVVIAQMARAQAQAESVREDADLQALRRRHADLLSAAERLREQQRAARDVAAQEEDVVDRLRRELSALLAQLADAQRAVRDQQPATVDEQNLDEARRRLAWFQRQIADTIEQLREAQKRAGSKSFAVVPYNGLHGTRRRPIYIECRKDRVILQPTGVEFTEDDFALDQAGGPLETALRATIGYLERTGQIRTEAPYPMLLVRPEGVGAYYAALDTVAELDLEYGYELVDEDWDLAFEPPDARLAQLQAQAAHNARDVQRRLLAARGRTNRRRSPAFQLGSGGGLQAVDDGFGGGGEGGGFASAGDGPGGDRDGTGGIGGGGGGPGGDGPPRAFTAPEGNAALAGGPDGVGGDPLGAGGSGQESFAVESSPSGTPYGARGAAGDDEGLTTLLGGGPQGRRGAGGTGGGTMPGGDPNYGGPNGDDPTGSGSGPTATDHHLSGGPGGDGAAGSAFASSDNPAGSQPGSAAGATGGNPSGGNPAMGANAAGGGNPGGGSPAMGANAAAGGSALTVQSGSQQAVARQRGFNWALPGSRGKTTAISRPIDVALSDRALAILDRRPQAPPRSVVRFRGDTAASVNELQQAVEQVIDGWGIAGGGMYWKPVLRVQLAPDGVRRYQDLRALMRGSGIDLEAVGPRATRPAAGGSFPPRSFR